MTPRPKTMRQDQSSQFNCMW